MKKELTLGKSILKCYQKGRVMTMLLSQNVKALPWLYYNNMQICSHKLNDKGEPFVIDICNSVAPFIVKEWDVCPYIHDNSYSVDSIQKKGISIVDFIIESIDNGKYLYFCVNTSYIHAYNKRRYTDNSVHDIFISGYDKVKKIFICHDYFFIDYEKKYIPFIEIEQGIYQVSKCKGVGDYVNGIHLLMLQTPGTFTLYSADDINKYNIIQKMYEILNPKYSEVHNMLLKRKDGDKIHTFGLEVYDGLQEFLKIDCVESVGFDYRPFYVIKDHIQILHDAIRFFNMPFQKEAEDLLKYMIKLTRISLKEAVRHNQKNITQLCTMINEMKYREKILLESVIEYYDVRF